MLPFCLKAGFWTYIYQIISHPISRWKFTQKFHLTTKRTVNKCRIQLWYLFWRVYTINDVKRRETWSTFWNVQWSWCVWWLCKNPNVPKCWSHFSTFFVIFLQINVKILVVFFTCFPSFWRLNLSCAPNIKRDTDGWSLG